MLNGQSLNSAPLGGASSGGFGALLTAAAFVATWPHINHGATATFAANGTELSTATYVYRVLASASASAVLNADAGICFHGVSSQYAYATVAPVTDVTVSRFANSTQNASATFTLEPTLNQITDIFGTLIGTAQLTLSPTGLLTTITSIQVPSLATITVPAGVRQKGAAIWPASSALSVSGDTVYKYSTPIFGTSYAALTAGLDRTAYADVNASATAATTPLITSVFRPVLSAATSTATLGPAAADKTSVASASMSASASLANTDIVYKYTGTDASAQSTITASIDRTALSYANVSTAATLTASGTPYRFVSKTLLSTASVAANATQKFTVSKSFSGFASVTNAASTVYRGADFSTAAAASFTIGTAPFTWGHYYGESYPTCTAYLTIDAALQTEDVTVFVRPADVKDFIKPEQLKSFAKPAVTAGFKRTAL